ncbi:MAG: glucosaminidase domain-containing protein [Prolixibacteraceae bacterium]|nr:glucosaminidase domain-containing protein [Prolixibacteraceae bacterium]
MKPVFLLIAAMFVQLFSLAQTSRRDYINKYQLLAIEEMNRSGIPASITMAQACLESSDGTSKLAKKSNNHFGIKCKKGWKGKKMYYDDDKRHECFRKYKTVEDSYIDHTNFLMNNPRYALLFKLAPTDYKGWAKGLKKAGYATANHYDKHLISIIEEFQLYRLDYKINYNELSVFEQQKIDNEGVSNTLSINPYQTHEVVKRNRINSVVARTGDTFEILAQEFGLKSWELYKFNDQAPGYRPQPNEVVYIQPKKRRTIKERLTHTVQQGETMHFISQMYGIKLKPLYFRNRMKPGQQPAPGQIIYLRKRKKRTKQGTKMLQ